MYEEIFLKLEQLKTIYKSDEDRKIISDLEKHVKLDMMRLEIAKSPAVLELCAKFHKLIDGLNTKLLTDYGLLEADRKAIMLQRDNFVWLVGFFEDPANTKNVEEFIEEKLSD